MNDDIPEYLGDGVYARYNGFSVEIFTYDGVSKMDSIFLEPRVIAALNSFYKRKAGIGENQDEV